MLRDLLTLTNVQVRRRTASYDGQGETSHASTLTTLPCAVIWSPSQSKPLLSDKITRMSTHVLVTLPADYTFTVDDFEVTYGGNTYRITGPSDDIMGKGEITVTGLELMK
jgi:hypothetical protein